MSGQGKQEEFEKSMKIAKKRFSVCVCVCVWERKRKRERERERKKERFSNSLEDFFLYPPSFGIAPCVGTAETVKALFWGIFKDLISKVIFRKKF